MTTTNTDRVRRYKARQRGEHVAEVQRGRPAPPVVIDYDAVPAPQPRRLRKLQRVTW